MLPTPPARPVPTPPGPFGLRIAVSLGALVATPLLFLGVGQLVMTAVPENDCNFEQACAAGAFGSTLVFIVVGVLACLLALVGFALCLLNRRGPAIAARILAVIAVALVIPFGLLLYAGADSAYQQSDCHREHTC